jgi:hypothetical protein
LVISGCGSGDDDQPGTDGGAVDDPDAQVQACTEEPCLDPPASGFQVSNIGTTIQAGEDVEYCEVVQLPGDSSDTYYVNKFEASMTTGSHHLIVQAIEAGSATEDNVDVGDRRLCQGPGGFGEDTVPVTGSQHPYNVNEFPAGVGRVYKGGQYLVFNYHYLNTTDGPLPARATINFHTVDEAQVQYIADDFGFYNLGINTPPGESASFQAECTVNRDLMLYKLVRHTHRWGTDFKVWYAGGPNDGDLIFETPNYEDTQHVFDQPISVQAGEGFRFECNYTNTETYPLVFGLEASDEMCILFGTYWTPDDPQNTSDLDCFRF